MDLLREIGDQNAYRGTSQRTRWRIGVGVAAVFRRALSARISAPGAAEGAPLGEGKDAFGLGAVIQVAGRTYPVKLNAPPVPSFFTDLPNGSLTASLNSR